MLLRDKDRERIISLAKQTLKEPCKVVAYGSRVNGKAHDTSDLDLVLVSENEQEIPRKEFVDFTLKLKDSNIPILIQILDWNKIPESFHINILENSEEIVRVEG